MSKKIDLESNPKFRIMDVLNSIDIFYKGYKITPEGSNETIIQFSIRSPDDNWVASSVKTLDKCKSIIDLIAIKKKGFKPFTAYYESGERIVEIKVNSLSKEGREFNAVRTTNDSYGGYRERITLRPRSVIYKKNDHNAYIIALIKKKQEAASVIDKEIYELKKKLKKDESLNGYLDIKAELDT